MATQTTTVITVENTVNAPVAKVWDYWNKPEHITQWNHASDDWHSPWAKNDLQVGGRLESRMEAKDGSFGFDFWGIYDVIREHEYIEYTLGDNRKVKVTFTADGNITRVSESFEAESTHSVEMQKGGWQAILDNFKKYTEAS
ncbi:MAG: SRPBCC family protein [Chitinophagaceae bacterium]|nr:SRPBCC family protein [Chitinophagaceae bacterium]